MVSTCPALRRGIAAALFGDGGILHDSRSGRIFVLNPSATKALKALQRGESEDEIVHQLSDMVLFDPKAAKQDLHQFIESLDQADLLEAEEQDDDALHLPPRPADASAALDAIYRIGDRLIRVVCHPCDIAAAFEQVASPCLAAEEVSFQACITLFQHEDVFYVLENDRVVDRVADTRSARWALVRELVGEGRGRSWLALLHASAVMTPKGCLLLCGGSGAGKSTLLTGLVHAGFAYIADDIVLMERGTRLIWPTPLAISIKESGWPLVERLFPQLGAAPIIHFGDRTMRYLRLDPTRVVEEAGYPLMGVLFVRYEDGAATSLDRLDVTRSLVCLGEGGSILPDTNEGLASFLATWRMASAWELTYSRLDEAIEQLSSLTGGPERPTIGI